jgi:putative heme iron utilization protein
MTNTKDRTVEAEVFLQSLCAGSERILIVKQDGVISEIRGKVECSYTEEWITLKMPDCRCHIHLARAELARATFVVRAKAEGRMSYCVEIKSQEGVQLLKVYFPGACDEPVVTSYESLKTQYGEEVVFSRGTKL